jgi:CheY-like chemotaxis protein
MKHKRIIKILLIEDDLADTELIREVLLEEMDIKLDIGHTDRLSLALDCLKKEEFDIILSDLSLPDSRGIETFVHIHDRFPNIPIIVLTGLDEKVTALKAVRKGAQDYILKGQISNGQLLSRAILHSIERHKLLLELEKKMREIKTLKGLIPMCAWCRKIRDDNGYWKKVEEYISEHTDAAFTHGMCEECEGKARAELDELKKIKAQSLEMIG